MKVLIGSENPVKVGAVVAVFARYFGSVEVAPVFLESGVSKQPIDQETFVGAQNRAVRLAHINDTDRLGAEFVVGIEGGVTQAYGRWFGFGVVMILDDRGRSGVGITSHFQLPGGVVAEVTRGVELGIVIDALSGQTNTRAGVGAVGFFTRGAIDRQGLIEQGVVTALVPFLHPSLFFQDEDILE